MIGNVYINVVPPASMRYRTVGDWFFDGTDLIIKVADTKNWRYNLLVAIHELIEVFLCTDKGITSKQVDRFDFSHENDEDPGSHPKAPYQAQHLIAMGVEMMLAAVLGVKWRVYEAAIEKAWSKTPRRKKK